MKKAQTLIPAVGLIRMSSKSQDKSPAQQKAEIYKHAERQGYRIVRFYADEGKSGGKHVEKRTDFLQMIEDAERLGDFRVIVTWDRNRFDRLDTLEGAEFKRRLRNADVVLDTVKDGVFDWSSDEGALKETFHSLKGRGDLVKLSRDVIRGQVDAIKNRQRTHGGQPPYGMARLVTDDSGQSFTVPRGKRMLTPDEWEVVYVEGDPAEMEIVRWLFEETDSKDTSPYALARELNERSVPSPAGLKWRDMAVRRILRDRNYVGDYIVGQKHTKQSFHRFTKDGDKPNKGPDGKLAKSMKGNPDEMLVCVGRWEPVIDQQLFARVQRRLDLVRDTGRKPRSADAGYPLSSILICGHCGANLVGGRKALKDGHVTRYNCGRFMNLPGSCIGAKIDEPEIIFEALGALSDNLTPERIKRIAVRKDGPKGDPAGKLRARREQVVKAIDNGTRRVSMATNDKVAAGIMADLEKLYDELADIDADLRAYENPTDVPALVAEWAERHQSTFETYAAFKRSQNHTGRYRVMPSKLDNPAGQMDGTPVDPLTLRRMFQEIGLTVAVHWKERKKRTREGKYQIDRCEFSIDLNQLVIQRSTRRGRSTAGPGNSGSTCARNVSGRSCGR